MGDEAALDKSIEDSINLVRAESNGETPVLTQNDASKMSEAPAKDGTQQVASESPSPAPEKTEPESDRHKIVEENFKTPQRGKNESEESFQLRLKLSELVKLKKSATNEDDRNKIAEDISQTRKDLRKTTPASISNSSSLGDQPTTELDTDPANQKPLTLDDLNAALEQRDYQNNVKSTLDTFFNRHQNLSDPDVRAVFFDFVDGTYNWNGKSGSELMAILELAHDSMFRPSETLQERVLNSVQAGKKVEAMDFPGGTFAKAGLPADQEASVRELMATGLSEETARELVS